MNPAMDNVWMGDLVRPQKPRLWRNVLMASGLALLLLGGGSFWRVSHPVLTDEQQIEANLEELRVAVEARDARGVLKQLSPGFNWNGQSRKTIAENLPQVFFNWRDVRVSFTKVKTIVRGRDATLTGRYNMTFRPQPKADADTHSGSFSLQWRKLKGEWKIDEAQGGAEIVAAAAQDGF